MMPHQAEALETAGREAVHAGPPIEAAWITERGLPVPPFVLSDILAHSALRFPQCSWFGDARGHMLTYGDGFLAVRRFASALQVRGVRPGDRVGICMANDPMFAVACFGAWLAGAVVFGMHPAYAVPLLARQVADASPKILVSKGAELVAKVAEVATAAGVPDVLVFGPTPASSAVPLIDAAVLLEDAPPFEGAHVGLDDLAVLQFTGGTTGLPKAAMLTHRQMSINLAQMGPLLPRLTPGEERVLAVPPFAHIMGLAVVLCLGTYLGSEIVLETDFRPAHVAEMCRAGRVSYLLGVPTLLAALSDAAEADPNGWASLKYVAIGGAPLPREVQARFERLTGCQVTQGYGLSETAPGVAFTLPGVEAPSGACGKALADTTLSIRDPENGLARLIGQVGEICVAGPQVMAGYWRRPEETASVLFDGVFRTGDLGYLDEKGYLFIVDRLKDIIIASGYNVYPALVEEALYEHPAVREAAVVGVPCPYRGETVKAVVALVPGTTLSLEELQAFLKDRLSPMEMPRMLEVRDGLPRSVAGKILRREVAAS